MPPLVPAPPGPPVLPLHETWRPGVPLSRVHHHRFRPAQFNPGPVPRTRFAFFGNPGVPVLYAGATDEVAVAETLFHDVPASGGRVASAVYAGRHLSVVTPKRDLELAQLHSGGLRALKIKARNLTDTEASHYTRTAAWAAAIHRDNPHLHGMVWMSRHWNSQKALVVFGDRVTEADFDVVQVGARVFNTAKDFDWLEEFGQRLHIKVMPFSP